MEKFYFKPLVTSLLLLLTIYTATAETADTLFVKLNNGELYAFPSELIKTLDVAGGSTRIVTIDDSEFVYANSEIASRSNTSPQSLPVLTSFKLNNKYNDQVYMDVNGDLTVPGVIGLQVGAIGRWLTPSFSTQPASARVYVDGIEQVSKETRLNFANPITYTVAEDGQYIFKQRLISQEVRSEDAEYTQTKVNLTAEMLSTNAPSNKGEDPANILDGNTATFYHSTWGSDGPFTPLPLTEHPYLQFQLPEALRYIIFSYSNRYDNGERYMKDFILQASNDGNTWQNIKEYTLADGLPTAIGGTFTSPVVDLGTEYRHLRILLIEACYKNYMCISEFALYKVEYTGGDSDIISPAVYEYGMSPYGTDYTVNLDWLTDKATRVPRIDINVENGVMISSKDYYLNAEIIIDGAGVFPSMKDSVQIKGRGNTSWNGGWMWDKNPYRLKFAEKVKPFGLTKGKNWVLLANKQSNSMMANPVGMKIACAIGTPGANHIVPVDLYINGNYRGSYNFTEKVGLSNNSIELDDESAAALLELDTYYDETYKFRTSYYNLPVNIKEPDFTDPEITITQNDIITDMRTFLSALSNKLPIGNYVDIDYLARYLLVNELIMNYEILHPKSTFLYKEYVGDNTDKFIFGPVWDLDWAFGYEHNKNYFQYLPETNFWNFNFEAKQFIHDLRMVDEEVDKAYYFIMRDFMENHLEEVLDFCDDYYAYAKPSFENNAYTWGDGTQYDKIASNAKIWLKRRAEHIYKNLTVYDIEEPIEDGIETIPLDTHGTTVSNVDVYDLRGVCVKRNVSIADMRNGLAPGIYIVNGKKIVVK